MLKLVYEDLIKGNVDTFGENIKKALSAGAKAGDILKNVNHGFEIEIKEIGKKNTRYINLETGEKVKSFTSKLNFMLRNGVFVK